MVSGSDNIYLQHRGAPEESKTIRIGENQTRAFVSGVRGVTTGLPDAVNVMIDSNGQLGTMSSSRKVKEDITDMGDTSKGLMELRPVTFRYEKEYADGSRPIQYGLIAEEVARLYPDLIVYTRNGEPRAVQYHKVNAMLLNEVQKQHRRIQEQHRQMREQQKVIANLAARLDVLEAKTSR